jgi:hypothetical protein
LVVDGQVGLGERYAIEFFVAESKRTRVGNESALVAQNVLDVLGADVAVCITSAMALDVATGPNNSTSKVSWTIS